MFMADHSKPDLYGLGTEGTPYRGRIIQLRRVQTCLRLSCLSVSFLDAIFGSCSWYLKGMKLWWF